MSRIYLTKDGIYKGNLILVNEDILIHENAIPGLKAVNGSDITLRYTAALHLETAMTEINGWSEITPVSGYRSLAEQQKIWDDSLKESGMEFTEKIRCQTCAQRTSDGTCDRSGSNPSAYRFYPSRISQ